MRPPPPHLACAMAALTFAIWACQRSDPSTGEARASASASAVRTSAETQPRDVTAKPKPTFQRAKVSSTAETAQSPVGEAPRSEPAERNRYVVAALGDSITDERVGGGGYLKVLRQLCPESRFDHFGRGGDMTNQMRRRLERDLLPSVREAGYTHLIVYGGVNDLYSDQTAGRTNDIIEAELLGIYREARKVGLEIIAVTVSPWGGFTRYFNARRSGNTVALNGWILDQAGKSVDMVVDSYPLLSCGRPEVLCPDYETRHHDGIHPGEKGHERLGNALYAAAFSDCR